MARIVGIGANVHDTLITLPAYPAEDTKLRAERSMEVGGGPCGTALVAAAKLGADCAWLGQLALDRGGDFLAADMARWGVDVSLAKRREGTSFSSWIWLSAASATRTCVFDRGTLPPLILDPAQKEAIASADLLLLDGNEMAAAIEGAKIARENGVKVLLDAGGRYAGIEELLPLVDLLIPSEEFALGITGKTSVREAASELLRRFAPETLVITCGKEGGVILDKKGYRSYRAYKVKAADTNGAGDVFHGAYAYAFTAGRGGADECAAFASACSALKCTGAGGARQSTPTLPELEKFIKENER